MYFLVEIGIKNRKTIFFIKKILQIEKKAVILHVELRTHVRVAIKTRFY